MNAVVEQALVLWDMTDAAYRLIAARENQVFRVDHGDRSFAMRLHRKGYRTDSELRSELQWMDAVAQGGVHVPNPIPSRSGAFLHVVDGYQIDILTWLSGAPVGKTGAALKLSDRTGLFHKIGQEMARLHAISDVWTPPQGFVRCSWDRKGLLGPSPLWDRFWDNPTLNDSDRALFTELRQVADTMLARIEEDLDFGLIHADLVRENVMLDGDRVQLIDFDDAGFGFRLFDLATTLIKNMREEDYPDLHDALIVGYRSVRDIDLSELELFIVLRSATYVGWIITRMDEDGAKLRNDRFIRTTRDLARDYLARVSGRSTHRNGT
ncbi:phosphotransferase enzyme family protein [Ruegeria halocynthiae]|uniref:phosphotransferase enzyme family protein n=1 Tax=Ruegeria halocynthiae TaxID=985054 RepID=UPI00068A668F|nr:phosphotransferase [Ruegeria halocynthiae]